MNLTPFRVQSAGDNDTSRIKASLMRLVRVARDDHGAIVHDAKDAQSAGIAAQFFIAPDWLPM